MAADCAYVSVPLITEDATATVALLLAAMTTTESREEEEEETQ